MKGIAMVATGILCGIIATGITIGILKIINAEGLIYWLALIILAVSFGIPSVKIALEEVKD
jgi:hypothetical protein